VTDSRLWKLVLLSGSLLIPTNARAQSATAAAVALFDEGRAALQRGEVDVACAKFNESNRIDPAVGTAFNLANCEEQRGRLATAWVLFRQVTARMKPDDARLSVATERVAALEKRIPRVIFSADETTPAGTRVRVDELELASASFGSAIPLDPGEHRAIVRSPGKPSRTLPFTLAEGETTTLSLRPQDPIATKDKPRPDDTATGRGTSDQILGMNRSDAMLVAGGIGVTGLAVGIITGLVGLNAESTGNSECSDATRTCSQEGFDANQRAKTMAAVSTVGFTVGILGSAAAGYLYFTAPTSGSSQQAKIFGLGGRW
jgi:hypothetical protein